jgi:hypothetical protein
MAWGRLRQGDAWILRGGTVPVIAVSADLAGPVVP